MTIPEIMRCPDVHYRKIVFELSPFITDYPEQVMLAGIVQGWCPKYANYGALLFAPCSYTSIYP